MEVTSAVPLVNLGNSTLSRTVDSIEVDNLPLVGRNAYRLLDLTPGVQSNTFENTVGFPAQHVIINGSPDDLVGEVSYYLDGGLNMTGLRNTGNALPNPDTIQEFVVQTNNFSAEYGRTGAGIVTVLTKSGTNQVHGSVFDFHRETNFDATSPRANQQDASACKLLRRDTRRASHERQDFPLRQLRWAASSQSRRTSTPSCRTRCSASATSPKTCPRLHPRRALAPARLRSMQRTRRSPTSAASSSSAIPSHTSPSPATVPISAPTTSLLIRSRPLSWPNVPLPTPGRTDNRYIGNMGLPNSTNEFLIKGDRQIGQSHRLTLDYFQSNGSSFSAFRATLAVGDLQLQYRQQTANASDVWTLDAR